MVSPLARRAQVAFARERGLSLHRACGLIGMSRSTPSYAPRLPAKDAAGGGALQVRAMQLLGSPDETNLCIPREFLMLVALDGFESLHHLFAPRGGVETR